MVLFHYEKVYNFDIADNENYYVTEDGILVHNGYGDIDETKKLMDNEGDVGTYKDLIKSGKDGDNLTPHHIPSDKYMKEHVKGYKTNDGICINMEQPFPGRGGRHRKTLTFNNMTKSQQLDYLNLSPKEALAKDIKDMIRIYKEEGLYNNKVREGLLEVIKQNKAKYPNLFK